MFGQLSLVGRSRRKGKPATWDTARSSQTMTYSGDKLTVFGGSDYTTAVATKFAKGDIYCEFNIAGGTERYFGFCNENHAVSQKLGFNANSVGFDPGQGRFYKNGSTVKTTSAIGGTMGLRYDTQTGLFSVYANGGLISSYNTGLIGSIYPACSVASGQNVPANFGASPFANGLPAGAISLDDVL